LSHHPLQLVLSSHGYYDGILLHCLATFASTSHCCYFPFASCSFTMHLLPFVIFLVFFFHFLYLPNFFLLQKLPPILFSKKFTSCTNFILIFFCNIKATFSSSFQCTKV
jgi:hypothetical protein